MPDPLMVTVAVSTLGAGAGRLCLPEPRAGIEYLILVQRPDEAPSGLWSERQDVVRVDLADLGLSNSRNAGLTRATGDLLLFSDEDVTLDPDGILALRECFAQDPDLVLAAGWRAERLPNPPPLPAPLSRRNSGRICAPEFMVRMTALRSLGVRFDPDFGLGAVHGLGEDYVFVTDVLRAGGKGQMVPVVPGAHPHASTGDTWDDPALLAARRAVIRRVFGGWAPVVRLAYGLRHRHRLGGLMPMLRFMWSGR
ncbi:glycosyltransferase family 2 protein [Tritonibacter mobilis]|uniref:glycosyltransferase family 2 protein n=1 Tax=Tritonibacter mobilis TaxID=379347 RepID=UPI001C092972|nr:glycosyltransferase family A protein [Tritonibacter mobilis]MBU3036041.1 glycosyltransferase family 2 protein [Tritonibacter mobilis]WHQ85307.1 glycosyltransferase family A protein [Tritonibacter mobilis]